MPCLFCGGTLKRCAKGVSFDYMNRKLLKCKKCKKVFILEEIGIIPYNTVKKLKKTINRNEV